MAGVSSNLIEILIRVAGSQEAKRKLKETGDASKAMNEKVSDSAKQAQKLYTSLASATARVGSLIPTSLPFGQLAKDLTRVTSASLGTASAMKNLNVSMGTVAIAVGAVLGGLFAAKAAFDAMRASIRAAAETQESIIKVANAFKTLSQYSRDNVARATEFANSQQLVTKYSDEEILSTQALLAQLGRLSGDGLERATKATLDLASGLGRELPIAALIMAKAAQGSTWELRKYGLVIDENLPRTERWAAALRFVEEQFGGRAQEEIRGFNATLRQFGGAFKDVLTIVGSPLVVPLTKALHNLTVEMLKFSSARDAAQNKNLLPEDASIDAAFEAVRRLREEYDSLVKEKREFKLDGGKKVAGELLETQKELKSASDELDKVIGTRVRSISLDDAIAEEKKYAQAVKESEKALAAYLAGAGQSERKTRELEQAVTVATEKYKAYNKQLQAKFTTSIDRNILEAQRFIAEQIKAGQPRDLQLSIRGDVELEGIRDDVFQFVTDPKNWEALRNVPLAKITDFGVDFKANLQEMTAEDIERWVNGVKRLLREKGSAFLLKTNLDPAEVQLLYKALDFLINDVENDAVIQMRVILDQESANKLATGVKSFQEKFKFAGDEIEIFKFDSGTDKFKNIDDEIEKLRVLASALEGFKNPKDIIEGYNFLLRTISEAIPNASSQSREKLVALGNEIEQTYRGSAVAAAAAYKEILSGNKAIEALPDIRARIQFALKSDEFDKAEAAIAEFKAKLDEIPETDTRHVRFVAELGEFERQLDEAREKALQIADQISAAKAVFRTEIELGNFDGAQAQIEYLKALLDDLPELKKIKLEAEVKVLQIDLLDQRINSVVRTIDIYVELGNYELARAELENLKALAASLPPVQRLELEVVIRRFEFATLEPFKKEVVNQFNGAIQQIQSLPWNAISDAASSAFDAMFFNAQSVSDAILGVFKSMVSQAIGILARLGLSATFGSIFDIPRSVFGLRKGEQGLSVSTAGFSKAFPEIQLVTVPINVQAQPFAEPKRFGTPAPSGRRVEININALDTSSIRRSLETGVLGRELSRLR